MRKIEFEEELRRDELKKRGRIPVDYSLYSTEDEEVSDYEVGPDDLFPKKQTK